MAKSRKKKQTKKERSREGPRDPWFNPTGIQRAIEPTLLLGEVLYAVEQQEKRKRKRKTEVRQGCGKRYALLADLTYHYLNGSPGKRTGGPARQVLLGKHSRIPSTMPIFTRSFPQLSMISKSLGYLEQKKGKFSGCRERSTRTTIRAGTKLIERHTRTSAHFRRLGSKRRPKRFIILKRAKRGYWDEGGQIEYEDTPATRV